MKKLLTFMFLSIFLLTIASAEMFGYGRTKEIPVNYSLIPNVNMSTYADIWITTEGQIDNLGDITLADCDNDAGFIDMETDPEFWDWTTGAFIESDLDMQDYNIDNVGCIELDSEQICSWDSVNVSTPTYWDRTGTILSPSTSGDDIETTGDIEARFLHLPQVASSSTAIFVDGIISQSYYTGINIQPTINLTTANKMGSLPFVLLSQFLGNFDLNMFIGNTVEPGHIFAFSGNINSMKGFHYSPLWLGTGTITDSIGFHFNPRWYSGAWTNSYGLKVENVNQGTNNYAIYTGLGEVNFGDDVLLRNDNDKLCFGSNGCSDSSISFDGNDLIINSSNKTLFYNSSGSGSIGYGSAYTFTTINNKSGVLEDFNDGNDLINSDGTINHTAFGECYSQLPVKNESDCWLVNTSEYKWCYDLNYNQTFKKICNYEKIDKTNLLYNYTTNETKQFIQKKECSTYLKDAVDVNCEQAKLRQAMALLNRNINLYENLTDFDVGIMAENIYTQSKTINSSINYLDKFTKEKIENKYTHKNKEVKIIKGKPETLLNVEDRIVDLEGLALELKKLFENLFNKNTEQDIRLTNLEKENNLLKNELCKKDKTYSWCVIK